MEECLMPALFNENKRQKSGACKAGIMNRTKGEEYIRLFRNKRLTCSSALIKTHSRLILCTEGSKGSFGKEWKNPHGMGLIKI